MVSNEVKREQIPQMDWKQVALNGGPPCFFVEGPQYCGRAERWQGHGNAAFHGYVSLADLLATVRREAFKDAREMMDAPVPGTMASPEFRKGFESMRRLAKRVLDRAVALEASANPKEGMNG